MKKIDAYNWDYEVLEQVARATNTESITEVLDNILDEWLDGLDEETKEQYGLD